MAKKSSYTFLAKDAVTLQVAVIIPVQPISRPFNNFNSDPGMIEKLSSLNPEVVRLSDLLQNSENSVSFSIEI